MREPIKPLPARREKYRNKLAGCSIPAAAARDEIGESRPMSKPDRLLIQRLSTSAKTRSSRLVKPKSLHPEIHLFRLDREICPAERQRARMSAKPQAPRQRLPVKPNCSAGTRFPAFKLGGASESCLIPSPTPALLQATLTCARGPVPVAPTSPRPSDGGVNTLEVNPITRASFSPIRRRRRCARSRHRCWSRRGFQPRKRGLRASKPGQRRWSS